MQLEETVYHWLTMYFVVSRWRTVDSSGLQSNPVDAVAVQRYINVHPGSVVFGGIYWGRVYYCLIEGRSTIRLDNNSLFLRAKFHMHGCIKFVNFIR